MYPLAALKVPKTLNTAAENEICVTYDFKKGIGTMSHNSLNWNSVNKSLILFVVLYFFNSYSTWYFLLELIYNYIQLIAS